MIELADTNHELDGTGDQISEGFDRLLNLDAHTLIISQTLALSC